MNIARFRTFALVSALALLSPALCPEQPQKPLRTTQDDRVKKLEERADAAEKAAASAALEKEYITRTQNFYESYYQKILNTQMWTLGIMGLLLTGVFVLVARFSLKMIDERTQTATAGATVQMRNEYARALAKEVQKLWDSNAADIRKLKDNLAAQVAEFEQTLKDQSAFQIQFVHALAAAVDERHGDSLLTFRNALTAYKSGRSRNFIDPKVGATVVRSLFESVRKTHADNHAEKAREELADPLYNSLDEELALAALQSPWLTALINERRPPLPEPSAPAAPEPAAEPPRRAEPVRQVSFAESDVSLDDESDSCRLITT